MGIEDEIKRRMAQGATPSELIDEGYAKSTVYKVNRQLQRTEVVEAGGLVISDIYVNNFQPSLDGARVQPGDTAVIEYRVKNDSQADFYYRQFGGRPSWMDPKEWYAVQESNLLQPGDTERFEINFPIPENLQLGNYPVDLGIDGAFMAPANSSLPSDTGVQYPGRVDLQVKQPTTGYQAFLSHAVENDNLYLPLTRELDNRGISVILGEEKRQPGADLKRKFADLIRESDVFLCLYTTEARQSEWVEYELNQALQMNKPMVPMVEDRAEWPLPDVEYVPFSRYDQDQIPMKAIRNLYTVLEQESGPNENLLKIIGLAFTGAVVGGLLSAGDDDSEVPDFE